MVALLVRVAPFGLIEHACAMATKDAPDSPIIVSIPPMREPTPKRAAWIERLRKDPPEWFMTLVIKFRVRSRFRGLLVMLLFVQLLNYVVYALYYLTTYHYRDPQFGIAAVINMVLSIVLYLGYMVPQALIGIYINAWDRTVVDNTIAIYKLWLTMPVLIALQTFAVVLGVARFGMVWDLSVQSDALNVYRFSGFMLGCICVVMAYEIAVTFPHFAIQQSKITTQVSVEDAVRYYGMGATPPTWSQPPASQEYVSTINSSTTYLGERM